MAALYAIEAARWRPCIRDEDEWVSECVTRGQDVYAVYISLCKRKHPTIAQLTHEAGAGINGAVDNYTGACVPDIRESDLHYKRIVVGMSVWFLAEAAESFVRHWAEIHSGRRFSWLEENQRVTDSLFEALQNGVGMPPYLLGVADEARIGSIGKFVRARQASP